MDYYIHPSHEGHGDKENQPHVHVCFGSKSDKSTQVSVSLTDCRTIVSGRDVTYRQEKEAEDFVSRNRRSIQDEWDRKSGAHW